MTKPLRYLLLCLLCSSTGFASEPQYPVQSVEDGDTLLVEIDGAVRRLQLLGIDAPEDTENPKLSHDISRTGLNKAQLLELGAAATEGVRRLLPQGTRIRIKGDLNARDKYGRIPVNVYLESGHSLSEHLVSEGFAVTLARPPLPSGLKQRLLSLQQQAREQKKGLWSSHPEAMSRWSALP